MVDYVTNEGQQVAIQKKYSDLDLSFIAHPVTGDVTRRTDSDAVRRAVRNIVLTNKYERPFKPNFGSSLREMLFELDTDRKINRFKKTLKEQIEVFEPRVTDVAVDFDMSDNNEMNVTVYYNIINGYRDQELQLTVSRVR